MPYLNIPATRWSPAEWEVADEEYCVFEGCSETPETTCDVCCKPCCAAHSQIVGEDRDRICTPCMDAMRAMEAA
jgi:hypothetical protein